MRRLGILQIFLTALAGVASPPVGIADVRISPLDVAAAPAGAPTLPRSGSGDAFWEGAPAMWKGRSGEIIVKAWLAAKPESLLLHVVVADPEHSNPYYERNLWRGDCLYVSLDGRGDTTGEALMLRDLPTDDATFVFGLGGRGAEGRCTQHGRKSLNGSDQTALVRSIHRDDAAKTTTYDLRIPWAILSTAWGQSDRVGVALHVAHKDAEGNDTPWGRMRATPDQPRKLNVLGLDLGDDPLAGIAPRRTRLLTPDQVAEAVAAVRSRGPATVAAQLGEQSVRMESPGGPQIARYLVSATAADIRPGADQLRVSVQSDEVAEERAFDLATPDVVLARLDARIASLRETAANVIVRDHLDSTRAVVRSARVRLDFEAAKSPQATEEFLRIVELIHDKLPQDKLDWEDHVRRGLPLVLAFVSDRDRTLQFCSLQMPFDYEAGRRYPLTVYLHGAGSANPLGNLSTSFDNTGQDTLFTFDEIDPQDVPPSHRGFVLAPWARGNSMYRDAGEDDVWQAIDLVETRFSIDPDRRYISGFSMGCSGAWALAARRPDFWAGVNLASGFGSWSDTELDYLDENLRGMGIAIWIGELDRMVDGARALHDRLAARGIEHRFEIVPRLPHTYPYPEFQENIGYLMRHERHRPAEFTFTTDTPEHAERRGVRMIVPRGIDPDALPTFTCEIDDRTVRIGSRNAPALRVDLGPGGLGLDGEVTVIWNGRQAYRGPVGQIGLRLDEFGQGPPG